MAASTGFVAMVLWPLYGLFCSLVLGLPERMLPRIALGAAYLAMALLARARRFGATAHTLWILSSAVGMVWLPWMLYLDSGRAPYWVASISFFGTIFGFALRPPDVVPALATAVGLAIFTDGLPACQLDLGMTAVFLIAAWVGSRVNTVLGEARARILQQNRRIVHQNNRLKELDRAKNVFTASVAHDLRTPLSVATCLAAELASESLSETARHRLDSLSMALGQLRRQSDNLFDLERFQLGAVRLDPFDIDMVAWIRHFEEGFASIARAHGLSFQVVLHCGALHARLDPVRMETVLHNLVSNALKFTPRGGHVEVHLATADERTLLLSVIDDGEGIPPASLPNIFDRFQQVDRGPGTYTVGAGIGLALVREIVEAHGGSVRVESAPNLGSLFEIRVPEAVTRSEPPPSPSPTRRQDPSELPRPGLRALVVEDDMLLRHVLHDILEGVATVATAGDGVDGLRMARETRPDVVVSDVAMPRMDGLEMFRAMRADPLLADVPVVLLSGDPVSVRARLTGSDKVAVHPKPFDRDALVGTIREMAAPREDIGLF